MARASRFLVPFAFLSLGACRNLGLPDAESRAVGPTVQFANLSPGQRVPRAFPIQLVAEDSNGVRSVTLSCSAGLVRRWDSPPFEGQVDLSRCLSGAQADGGPEEESVTLVAEGIDALGDRGPPDELTVTVDVTQAVLAATVPERVLPRSRLQFEVTSDRPLRAPPSVQLEGWQAQVQEQPGGAMTRFDVVFPETPGLGADVVRADAGEVPQSLLEQVSRTLGLSIEGMAESGNPTRLELSILLSRIVWERSVPGGLIGPSRELRPAGTRQGVTLPVPVGGDARWPWLPSYLRASDGVLTPIASGLLEGSVSPVPRAISSEGLVLLQADAEASWVQFGGQTSTPIAPGLRAPDAGTSFEKLYPAESAVCEELVDPYAGCALVNYEVNCAHPDGGTVRGAVRPATDELIEPSNVVVRSGDVYIGASVAQGGFLCCPDVTGACKPRGLLVGTPSALSFWHPPSFDGAYLLRLLPVGDGSFVMATDDGQLHIQHLDPVKKVRLGSYLELAPGKPPPSGSQAVMALPDATILVVRPSDPPTHTLIERWKPGAVAPLASARLTGSLRYFIDPNAAPELPLNAGFDPGTGEIAMLLESGVDGAESHYVALLGPDLGPRLLFRYPRRTSALTLAWNDGGELIYLVDVENEYVTALAR